MRRLLPSRVGPRVVALVAGSVLAVILPGLAAWIRWELADQEHFLEERADVLARTLALSLEYPLAVGDWDSAAASAAATLSLADVVLVAVEDEAGQARVSLRAQLDTEPPGGRGARVLRASSPVGLRPSAPGSGLLGERAEPGRALGNVHVGLSEAGPMAALWTRIAQAVLLVLLTAALAIAGAAWVATELTRPLERLREATEALARGQLDRRVELHGSTELIALGASFNSMACALESTSAELRAHAARLGAILTSMTDLLFVMDRDGRLSAPNRAMAEAVGLPIEVLDGTEVSRWLGVQVVEQLRRGDGAGGGERAVSISTVRGGEVPVDLSCAPLAGEGAGSGGLLCVGRDLRATRLAEELRRANQELERLLAGHVATEAELREARNAALEGSRLKSQFLANMSHEIRTPMNGVLGMTTLLLESPLRPDQRDFAATIHASAEHLLAVINDILDFSKIEAGRLDIEQVDFDLCAVVEGTLELLADQAQRKGLQLVNLLAPDLPCTVTGDPSRLRQILTNLIGNAVKFTESGSVSVRARWEAGSQSPAWVDFEVADTGIGISRDAQTRLFSPFTQADGSTTRRYGGTGLGLAISRQLVELMGGTITVESQVGEGTRFCFRLPYGLREPAPRPLPVRGRVLLVEARRRVQAGLEPQLAALGLEVRTAESAAAAHTLLAAEPFALILTTMTLPDGDALEILEHAERTGVASAVLVPWIERGQLGDVRQVVNARFLLEPVRRSALAALVTECLTPIVADGPGEATDRAPPPDALPARRRVLVVEDNPVNQKVSRRMLELLGCESEVVENGARAVDAVLGRRFDFVLMDCQMPVMDGYAATAEIRRREGESKHTLIFAMTANAMEGDRQRCLDVGMDDYLSKPVRKAELQALLERWS